MAIMPHCVVCGFSSGAPVADGVAFADYDPGWRDPRSHDGRLVIGWMNSLGVTAPEGVGLFCREHLKRAKKLRRLRSDQAVEMMRTGADLKPWARLRNLFR